MDKQQLIRRWEDRNFGKIRPSTKKIRAEYNKQKEEKMNNNSLQNNMVDVYVTTDTCTNPVVTVGWGSWQIFNNESYSLVCTTGTTPAMCGVKQEETEKGTAMSIEQNAIDYLTRRVENVYANHYRYLPGKFNLYVDNTPKTYKELIEAIKNDKFKLDKKRVAIIDDDDDNSYIYGPFDGIIWDGPQSDNDGYDKACDALQKARIDATDIIKTSTDADKRLQALKDFEKWTPESAAN